MKHSESLSVTGLLHSALILDPFLRDAVLSCLEEAHRESYGNQDMLWSAFYGLIGRNFHPQSLESEVGTCLLVGLGKRQNN